MITPDVMYRLFNENKRLCVTANSRTERNNETQRLTQNTGTLHRKTQSDNGMKPKNSTKVVTKLWGASLVTRPVSLLRFEKMWHETAMDNTLITHLIKHHLTRDKWTHDLTVQGKHTIRIDSRHATPTTACYKFNTDPSSKRIDQHRSMTNTN